MKDKELFTVSSRSLTADNMCQWVIIGQSTTWRCIIGAIMTVCSSVSLIYNPGSGEYFQQHMLSQYLPWAIILS